MSLKTLINCCTLDLQHENLSSRKMVLFEIHTEDNDIIFMDYKTIQHFPPIKNICDLMTDNCDIIKDASKSKKVTTKKDPIQISLQVDSPTLKLILEWLQYNEMSKECKLRKRWFPMDNKQLFNLINATNYLEVDSVFNYAVEIFINRTQKLKNVQEGSITSRPYDPREFEFNFIENYP